MHGRTLPWMTIMLTGLTLALYAGVGPAAAAWVFDRAAIADGEIWRLVSGHWIHSDLQHLAWNTAALAILGTIVERQLSRTTLLAGILTGSLAVDLGIGVGLPSMDHYCGLSGLLNTLLLQALVGLYRASARPVVWLIGLGSGAKILIEWHAGQALLTHTAWPPVPLAHLVGWLAGLALVICAGKLNVAAPFYPSGRNTITSSPSTRR